MWNPFLTADERAMLCRGRELHRQHDPLSYWMARVFIGVCVIGCAVILAEMLIIDRAFGSAAVLVAFWAAVWLACSWGAAQDIRHLD